MTTDCQAASGGRMIENVQEVVRLRLGSPSDIGKSNRPWGVSQLLRGGYTVRIKSPFDCAQGKQNYKLKIANYHAINHNP